MHGAMIRIVMRNLAPSSYLISSQSTDPCPEVEITMKNFTPLTIITHFTSSEKHDLTVGITLLNNPLLSQ